MTRWVQGVWAVVLAGMMLLGVAQVAAAEGLEIRDPRANPSYGQTAVGAVFMTVRNPTDRADTLRRVSSPMAGRIELHTNEMTNDIMRMRKLETMAVPARGELTLAPGGKHLMLFRLKEPLRKGMEFPLTLEFEHAGTVVVTVPVR